MLTARTAFWDFASSKQRELKAIMRVGWYREVTVKGHDCQALRALLVARGQIVSQITTVKNCVRGILKTFGHILPKKLRATTSPA